MDAAAVVGLGRAAWEMTKPEPIPIDDVSLEIEYQQALQELKDDRPRLDDDWLLMGGVGLAGAVAGLALG